MELSRRHGKLFFDNKINTKVRWHVFRYVYRSLKLSSAMLGCTFILIEDCSYVRRSEYS